MNKSDLIKKINKNIVHEDGTIDSFDKQLIDFVSGEFNYSYPLVVAEESATLSYIPMVDTSYPIIMNISTIMKLQSKHHLSLSTISESLNFIKDSVFAFESLTEDSSVIIVLNQDDSITGTPYIMSVRYDKTIGSVSVNEITSFYEKERFIRFIERTYEANKDFFKREDGLKEKHIERLNRLQLPKNILYALSNSYDKALFNKNQVEADLKKQPNSMETEDLSKTNTGNESEMVQTNIGEMPMEDYLEIKAMQYGFDSYEELNQKSDFDYITLDDSGKTVTIAYLNKDGHNGKGNIVIDEYDIDFLREYAQQHGNETLYDSASGFAKERIEDDITQIDKYLDGQPIDSKGTLNELIEVVDKIYIDNLSIDVHEYSDPFIFDDGDYYFEYEIFWKDKLIASGQDSIEGTDETNVNTIKEDIRKHLHYYVSKPNIHECGKIMQDCYDDCSFSESGMCFLEAECMDEYSDEDVKIFLDEVEQYKLWDDGIIETCLSIEDAKETGEAFATCYGALGNFFNNVTLEQQKLTNVIKEAIGKCDDSLVRDETEMELVEKSAGSEL